MLRINLVSRNPCPTCGGDMTEDFDGGSDTLYEFCVRERQVLRGPAFQAWWTEHEKRCPGPGRCRESSPSWVCNAYRAPPAWLAAARDGLGR